MNTLLEKLKNKAVEAWNRYQESLDSKDRNRLLGDYIKNLEVYQSQKELIKALEN